MKKKHDPICPDCKQERLFLMDRFVHDCEHLDDAPYIVFGYGDSHWWALLPETKARAYYEEWASHNGKTGIAKYERSGYSETGKAQIQAEDEARRSRHKNAH